MSISRTTQTSLRNKQMKDKQITLVAEGNEQGDLYRLLHSEIHIDEFRSKMGQDHDVCVISFKVKNKEPALDLVSFVEKGYTWVIDADVSSGEMDDGDYLVFVEVERDHALPKNIMTLLDDISKLANIDDEDWKFRYHTSSDEIPATQENIAKFVPSSPKEYKEKFDNKDIKDIKVAAGIPVESRIPKNAFTESLMIAAGIK